MGSINEIEQPIVLFDGVCNLCNGAVNFIIDYEKESNFLFAPLQSDYARSLLERFDLDADLLDSVVLVELKTGSVYVKSKAALKIASQLRSPFSVFAAFSIVPSFISDRIYDLIARNRYRWFGKTDQCRVPTPELKKRFIDSAIVS